MKCLICGNTVKDHIICNECHGKVTEELCYSIAKYNYIEPDNSLWAEIISQLEAPYKFRDLSLELAEYIKDARKSFVQIQCMNLMNSTGIGVSKRFREFVISNEPDCESNGCLSAEEKNLAKAILLSCYVSNYEWDKIKDIPNSIETDKVFIDTSLILADYYMKVYDYESALMILGKAKDIFKSESDQERLTTAISDCRNRQDGIKKAWRPSKREDIETFYTYLDSIGVNHSSIGNDKKSKIRESDFKAFTRYEESELPDRYVALWITSEFFMKVDEAVEINAIRVINGQIDGEFHSFVRPVNKPKKSVHVKEEDYLNAPLISEVFPTFLTFIQDNIIASAGFDEQKKLLSRLARYSMMDHISNMILDVVEYGEDQSDDFVTYTRTTLLEKYDVSEGVSGMEKAEATMHLVEKMRED